MGCDVAVTGARLSTSAVTKRPVVDANRAHKRQVEHAPAGRPRSAARDFPPKLGPTRAPAADPPHAGSKAGLHGVA